MILMNRCRLRGHHKQYHQQRYLRQAFTMLCIRISNYSSLSRLLRVTAYLLRFINNVRKPTTRNVGALSTEETNNALSLWIYDCQQTSFKQEYKQLKSKPAKRSSLVRQLRLFLDADGYICCGGRIHNAPLSELTRFPFLLPSKHPLTELVLNMIHVNQLHGGVNSVITATRQNFGYHQFEGW